MTITDKQKIKLCRKIIKNPELLGKTDIKGYDGNDLANFISHIGDRNNNQLSIGIVEDYKRELENHINSNSCKREIIIGVIGGVIGIFISNFDRIIKFLIFLFKK